MRYKLAIAPTYPIPDPFLEVMNISIDTDNTEIEIINVYPSISHLLHGDIKTIFGDFNVNRGSWYCQLPEGDRGRQIAEQIDKSDFLAINKYF